MDARVQNEEVQVVQLPLDRLPVIEPLVRDLCGGRRLVSAVLVFAGERGEENTRIEDGRSKIEDEPKAHLTPALSPERRGSEITTADGQAEILREMRLQRGLLLGLQMQMEAVARGNAELRAAKARLEQMQGENLFRFVQKVDDRAFRIVCAVLVHGDVAKAARALTMKDSTVRDIMATWKQRGGAYLGLLELVRWRKRKRITGTVPFNDALLYDDGGKTSRESVLAEVLDGLLSMTESNWSDVCAELETMLREHLGG